MRASGLVSSSVTDSTTNPSDINVAPDTALPVGNAAEADRSVTLNGISAHDDKRRIGTREAEEVAKLVWNFFKHAGEAVEGMFGAGADGDGEDELRLVRLRTKKREVVVVPGMSLSSSHVTSQDRMCSSDTDAKFLLCVIHDTPPA